MNRQRMVELLQGLVRIDSVNPPGNELEVAQYICEFASTHGLECDIHTLDEKRANVTVKLRGRDSTLSKVYFNGHLDTVPVGEVAWTTEPFGAEIENGRIYGRGTTDMKGGIAALLESMVAIKESGYELNQDLIFLGTVGEEVDCAGAVAAVESGLLENPGTMIIAEPSALNVYVAHKGALWVEISTYGKTAHGSMPYEGINAVDSMVYLINRLKQLNKEEEHPVLGKMSYSLNTVSGGVATNVVPDLCKTQLDFRTITASQNKSICTEIGLILKELTNTIPNFKAEYSIIHNLEPLSNENDSDFIRRLHLLNGVQTEEGRYLGANYYTDGSVFRKHMNVPIILYGPGDPELAHQPDESISIANMEKSVAFYMEAIRVYQESARTAAI
ncbi:succinyl-diaminopimelate desuccinylase [Bhargavaea ginsengi]|uniref:Probable succinyl-diaminopimelate desuccinylase n=1 Tax=Bhargavaea ginsengi TaxID=426757 RepID=A0A1H6UQJ5_9BACL|nr:M20 family metallopeptidase [Bhargavaea ginsengi]SEI90530.1 succinyl-diaminopimelate desuccinylase [Bhargavaea ginsengi]